MNEVRTYMPFTYPVDPAKIEIIPDMDMSYALAATLVEWDTEKQLAAGLAESWKVIGYDTYRFTLRKNASWSNGRALTAADVKKSLERGMATHPNDLRSLIQMVERIECPSEREIDFKLKVPARESGLLGKLTEPNFGILNVTQAGTLDLSVTTGAFALSSASNRQQLTLERNTHWHRFESNASHADRITIRRSPDGADAQTVLLNDLWPNLIETSSLIKADLLKRYERDGFEIWRRPTDKLFYLHLSNKAATAEGRTLMRFLRQKVSPTEVVSGLTGFTTATQIFPRGFQLYDSEFTQLETIERLPEKYRKAPLRILISPARVSADLAANIRRVVTAATGVEPHFISVPLDQVGARKASGDFDLYAGTIGLADPDPEGVMSFYLEGNTPLIHPNGNNFIARLDAARKEPNADARLAQMRTILGDALRAGDLLPLFHLSTVGIGRPELDFGQIPTSDESVTLSKIRFCSRSLEGSGKGGQ